MNSFDIKRDVIDESFRFQFVFYLSMSLIRSVSMTYRSATTGHTTVELASWKFHQHSYWTGVQPNGSNGFHIPRFTQIIWSDSCCCVIYIIVFRIKLSRTFWIPVALLRSSPLMAKLKLSANSDI